MVLSKLGFYFSTFKDIFQNLNKYKSISYTYESKQDLSISNDDSQFNKLKNTPSRSQSLKLKQLCLSEIAKSDKKYKTIDKSDLNIIEGFKQFDADDKNATTNKKDYKDMGRFENVSYSRDPNAMGQSLDDDAISNSYEMIMLKFKVAFKTIEFNQTMVKKHYLNTWKNCYSNSLNKSIKDQVLKPKDKDKSNYLSKDRLDIKHNNDKMKMNLNSVGESERSNNNNNKFEINNHEDCQDTSLRYKIRDLYGLQCIKYQNNYIVPQELDDQAKILINHAYILGNFEYEIAMLKSNIKDNLKLINLYKVSLKYRILSLSKSLIIWKKSVAFKAIYISRSATKQKSNIKINVLKSDCKNTNNLIELKSNYKKNNKIYGVDLHKFEDEAQFKTFLEYVDYLENLVKDKDLDITNESARKSWSEKSKDNYSNQNDDHNRSFGKSIKTNSNVNVQLSLDNN